MWPARQLGFLQMPRSMAAIQIAFLSQDILLEPIWRHGLLWTRKLWVNSGFLPAFSAESLRSAAPGSIWRMNRLMSSATNCAVMKRVFAAAIQQTIGRKKLLQLHTRPAARRRS